MTGADLVFNVARIGLGLLLLFGGATTALHSHGHAAPTWLGSLEAIAALLFLAPRTSVAGALGLLGVLLAAFALHGARDALLPAYMLSVILILTWRVRGAA
jgi:hypothetical protein